MLDCQYRFSNSSIKGDLVARGGVIYQHDDDHDRSRIMRVVSEDGWSNSDQIVPYPAPEEGVECTLDTCDHYFTVYDDIVDFNSDDDLALYYDLTLFDYTVAYARLAELIEARGPVDLEYGFSEFYYEAMEAGGKNAPPMEPRDGIRDDEYEAFRDDPDGDAPISGHFVSHEGMIYQHDREHRRMGEDVRYPLPESFLRGEDLDKDCGFDNCEHYFPVPAEYFHFEGSSIIAKIYDDDVDDVIYGLDEDLCYAYLAKQLLPENAGPQMDIGPDSDLFTKATRAGLIFRADAAAE